MSRYTIELDGTEYSVEILEDRGDEAVVLVDGREHQVRITGAAAPVASPAPRPSVSTPAVRAPVAPGQGPGVVVAPMSARVTRVLVAGGDRVEAGQVLLKIEAMKMENEIRSPSAGAVEEVCVSEGQEVAEGETLVKIKPD